MQRRRRDEFAGIPLWTGSLDGAVQRVLDDAVSRAATAFRLINSFSVYCARMQPPYAAILRGPGVNFIDGKPLTWAIAFRDRSRTVEQVRGPTLFERCMDAGRQRNCRHFLLGGSGDLLTDLQRALMEKYPGIDIAGTHAPPFGDFTAADRSAILHAIRAARPDIVWVGLGTPKQDVEAAGLTRELGVTSVAVGAAFDFSAGRKREASAVLRALGLEWSYRLWSEPARLWRRYLLGNTYFLLRAVGEHVTGIGRWETGDRAG